MRFHYPTAGGFAIAIFILAICNTVRHDVADPGKCIALRDHGRWSDPVVGNGEYRTSLQHGWTPPGCMLHMYQDLSDLVRCKTSDSLLLTFIGDMSMFQIYKATLNKTVDKTAENPKPDPPPDHTPEDHQWSPAEGIQLQFVWDPWLNGSKLVNSLEKMRQHNNGTGPERRPDGVLIGGGLWIARYLEDQSYRHFEKRITSILSNLTSGPPGKVFILPVLEPIYEKLSPSRKMAFMPHNIRDMNHYLEKKASSAKPPPHILWSFRNMTRGQPESYGESGFHVVQGVAHAVADVFLNLVCNGRIISETGYPVDRSCCVEYRSLGWPRLLAAAVLGVLGLAGWQRFRVSRTHDVSIGVLVMLAAAFLGYFADRTELFDKSTKLFSLDDLGSLIRGVLLCSVFAIVWQGVTGQLCVEDLPITDREAHAWIPRKLSLKLKGLATTFQFLLEYTSLMEADNTYIFQASRVVTATYFFLLGYGHAIRFVRNRDGWKETARIFIRLNLFRSFLSIWLMRPFLSWTLLYNFWYLAICIMFKVRPRENANLRLLVRKILICSILTLLFCSSSWLAYLSRFPFLLTRVGTVEYWQDRFTTSWGAIHAGLFLAAVNLSMMPSQVFTQAASLPIAPHAPPPGPALLRAPPTYLRIVALVFSLFLNYQYWFTTVDPGSDSTFFSRWFSTRLRLCAVAWVPLLPFLVLRNWLRLFRLEPVPHLARLGRLSLYLGMLWQHLLLAGDGRGVLRSGLFRGGTGHVWGDTMWELLPLLPILLFISWCVKKSVKRLISALLSDSGEARGQGEGLEKRGGGHMGEEEYELKEVTARR